VRYPVVVKSVLRVARALTTRHALSPGGLLDAYDELRPAGELLVQPYVPGPAYVVHALAADGETVALCTHMKERTLPIAGGVTSAGVTVEEPALAALTARLLRGVGFTGLASLEFQKDRRDGSVLFLEIHPRVSSTIDITRAAGGDQIALLCRILAGERVAPPRYRTGVHYRWTYPRDLVNAVSAPWIASTIALEATSRACHYDLGIDDPRVLAQALGRAPVEVWRALRTGDAWRHRRLAAQLGQLALAEPPSWFLTS